MTQKSDSSFQKTRDAAIRSLVISGGLTADQVSALTLNQVHLATGRVVIEPDAFAPTPASAGQPLSFKLDPEMQRTLIAWLVMRPDGPNDHLFPGTGLDGLDAATIRQVTAAAEAAGPPETAQPPDAPKSQEVTREERGKPAPESPAKKTPPPTAEGGVRRKSPSPRPATPPEEAEAVSLDEIEAMRKRLAEVYDDWMPAVTAAPPSTPVEHPGDTDIAKPEALPEPMGPPPEVGEPQPIPEPIPELDKTLARGLPAAAKERRGPAHIERPRPDDYQQRNLGDWLKKVLQSGQEKATIRVSYRAMAIGGGALLIVCCLGLAALGGAMFRAGGPSGLLAGTSPTETPLPTETMPPVTPVASTSPTPTITLTPVDTPSATAPSTNTPTLPPTAGPTPTPIIVVVTATSTPEPPPTDTPVSAATPAGGAPVEPTATPTLAFKYPAPVLLEPEDGGVVPGVYAFLKWEPVGPLADDEWYAVRLVFLQQGEPSYQGNRVKVPEWRVPERFYYQADGPALEYRWHVFVERENPDGSTTQISPESEIYTFRWQ